MIQECKNYFHNKMSNPKGIWFHFLGFACIIWFLVRVLPKPDRIRYPCQQLSMTFTFGYIAFWSVLFQGLILWLRQVKLRAVAIIPVVVVASIVILTASGLILSTFNFGVGNTSNFWNSIPNDPIGTPQGVNPGRVVWVWDENATEKNLTGYWWKAVNNNESMIQQMFCSGICALAGKSDNASAWNALFEHFNQGDDYQSGEKIVIKVNLNNCWQNPYTREDNGADANPYVVKALLNQLVNTVGVAQEDITVYDAIRTMANWFYDPIASDYPDVNYIDYLGGAPGRQKVTSSGVKIYFTNGMDRTLPLCVTQAKYFINMPIMKRHSILSGVTLSGKNHFGSFMTSPYGLHGYHESAFTEGNPAPQTDIHAHEHIGGKTFLYIGDSLFGAPVNHNDFDHFEMYPFNDDWANSLFFSQDGVAIDSVMYDFLNVEGDPAEGSQNYLHQSAEPPEGVYDPEGDGTYLDDSLGVHEHWNTSVDIFSSDRYLGPSGNGIDYIYYNIYNEPPETPSDPDPPDGATNVDINADLSWNCSDPDGDDLTYNVYFEANDPTPDVLVSENQSENTYDPSTMEYSTHYYWLIVAWDDHNQSTGGPVWDFTTGSVPNYPPYAPGDPDPENGSTDVDIEADLSWTGGDPDPEDTVVYDVFLEASDPTPDNRVADDISETTFDPGNLDYKTVYYWRIIAKDNLGASTWGPVWHFTTEVAPEPDLSCGGSLSWTDVKPGETVTGNFTVENIGAPGSELDWKITNTPSWSDWTFDPEEGNDLTPGEPVTVEVTSTAPDQKNEEFFGKIRIENLENPEDYCEISVSLTTPRNKTININPLFLRFLERHPNLFPALRYLLGL